ncbi:histone deacetylase [Phycicoccus ginsengisoli]
MQVWYACYGSNLRRDRFLCYVQGGRPEGARRSYPGARNRTLPADDRPMTLPGSVLFGWESPTWGGGIAFYDAGAGGSTLARAYLVTDQQFADVAAQEMHREPGPDLDLAHVLEHARHDVGPGRYESLLLVGELDGHPVLTFTTPDPAAVQPKSPAPAYLRTMTDGLREAHGLDDDQVADYVLSCPGAVPGWDAARLAAEVTGPARR